jgi:hypothetical protein
MDQTAPKIGRDQHAWSFDAQREPQLLVDAGSIIEIETWDCFTGQVQSEDDTLEKIDLSRVNSATGPIGVRRRARRRSFGDPYRRSSAHPRCGHMHSRLGAARSSGALADHADLSRE